MTKNLAAVARHNRLEADILAAKTPTEQLAAERALHKVMSANFGIPPPGPAPDVSGNFTVQSDNSKPLPTVPAPDTSGNFTVPRSDVPIVRPRFVNAAGDYK